MGAGIFNHGEASKGSRTREDSRPTAVLVASYDGGVGFLTLKSELWQSWENRDEAKLLVSSP